MALVGCVEAPADDADVNDDRTQAISLGDDASVGVFDVVAFDNATLRIASELRYARCSAQPCEVTPMGLPVPLLPDADGYLVAGAVFEHGAKLRVDAVYRGARTWGDGSGELYTLSAAAGKYRVCALPLVVAGPLVGQERTDGAVAVPTWQGGAPIGPSGDALSNEIDIAERADVAEASAKRCSDLDYVITNISGQDLLADALAHGDVLVRATPGIDAQKAGYAHLGMVYVRENAGGSR